MRTSSRSSVVLPQLHSGQRPIAEGIRDQQRVVIRAGRRFGKTSLLERTACKLAYQGKRVGWFSPQYKYNLPTYRRILSTLRPVVTAASKVDQIIDTRAGGAVEFWTLENEDAGRSRWYDLAIIDEGSLKEVGLREIFERAIAPTLLDRRGKAILAGTPKGIDPDSYFYAACSDKSLGWVEYHAPTAGNPLLDVEAVAALKDEYPPLVYQQEYLAEFVDWGGSAFFAEPSMLVEGQPIDDLRLDDVFAVVDTALKDGLQHDGTAVVYFGRTKYHTHKLTVLDWDILQIEGSLLDAWLPTVGERLEQLNLQYRSLYGSKGVWIEDKASGIVLLQQAQRKQMDAYPISGDLVSMGKEGRALNVSGHVHRGEVKLSRHAYEKTQNFRGQTRNHLISQVCGFRMGQKTPHQMDLLDCFTYGVAIALGDTGGY